MSPAQSAPCVFFGFASDYRSKSPIILWFSIATYLISKRLPCVHAAHGDLVMQICRHKLDLFWEGDGGIQIYSTNIYSWIWLSVKIWATHQSCLDGFPEYIHTEVDVSRALCLVFNSQIIMLCTNRFLYNYTTCTCQT